VNFAVLLNAPLAVKIHLATVLPAFAIGTWLIFFSRKGSPLHRAMGVIYLVLMTATAIAALFVRSINRGALSPIHLFVPLTFFGVLSALWNVRRGNIRGHRRAMLALYLGGIVVAGTLAFLPRRIMHALVFGP
jgi:uncharacterized membrane protein